MELGPKLPMHSESKLEPDYPLRNSVVPKLSDDEIEVQHEISSCADWILENRFQSVALQFPDNLLIDSARVSDILEKRIGFKPFILADTSYGSCCVDEVAAQHVDAQSIVHFGDSCMSASEGRIPVKRVFPRAQFDEEDFRSQLSTAGDEFGFGSAGTFALVIDVCLNHASRAIADIVKGIFSKITVFDLVQCRGDVGLPDDDNTLVLFVGDTKTSPRLTLLMLTNPTLSFVSYDPLSRVLRKEHADVNRILKKRLYLIEKAKDAHVIGVIIGALSVSGYLKTVNRVKSLCQAAGKKFIVLSVGKINVAKLSNFADAVDAFVWISCPFNIMLETSDYPHPILTPFELEVACNPRKRWYAASGWITDFGSLLKDDDIKVDNFDESTDPETDVSLITGNLRRLMREEDTTGRSSDALIPRSDAMQLQPVSVESRFAAKSWKGLEEKLGETKVTAVREGRSGIASGYQDEGSPS